MDDTNQEDDWMPIFYVGQHESKRVQRVTDHVLRQARDCNAGSLCSSVNPNQY